MYRLASLALALTLLIAPVLTAQTQSSNSQTSSQTQPKAAVHHPFGTPRAQAAPGGGPDKVWVNLNSKVYHCPGDRYYGKTSNGRYMTEKDALAFGAHGSRNEKCFAK
ncbi:MAG TPA: hypothetical protein VMD97_06875 [Candidatus Aquilonibacter sp.]|nr:hypothetical protein [Candidatus Aquilonibacter sp.]